MLDKSLVNALNIEKSDWMMHSSEKLAIIGLLNILKPERTLEYGCGKGGLTEFLSNYSKEVWTVDKDPNVNSVVKKFKNVKGICKTTDEVSRSIIENNIKFDFVVIDADHSEEGVKKDLENALKFSKIIVLHDTYNPSCRKGIERVLSNSGIFYNLDLVPGRLQVDGAWGGLGIVIRELNYQSLFITRNLQTYEWLSKMWFIKKIFMTNTYLDFLRRSWLYRKTRSSLLKIQR